MADRVVCGIDDSSGARKAARVADDLARDLGARLVLIHGAPVAPGLIYGVPFDSDAFQRDALLDARRLLAHVARACKCEEISQRAELGSPIEVLVRVVEERGGVGYVGRGRSGHVSAGCGTAWKRFRRPRAQTIPEAITAAS